MDDFKVYLRENTRYEAIEVLGYPPSIYYDMVLTTTGDVIGRLDLRIASSQSLYYEGHISYYVKPIHRGNNYTMEALKSVPKIAREHQLVELIFTCTPDNNASVRIIEAFGAEYIETVDIPKHNERYMMGEHTTNRYRLQIGEVNY